MKRLLIVLCAVCSLALFSCDNDGIATSTVSFYAKLPKSLSSKSPDFNGGTLTLTNVNTGIVTTEAMSSLAISFPEVEDGLYNIMIEGSVKYESTDVEGNAVEKEETVRALKENVEIVGGQFDMNIELFLFKASNGFIISEIFFAGTETPEGKQYNEDKYIELYNNSSEVLYADGLCIAESELNTAMSLNEYTPDIRPNETPVSSVYRIPGTGQEHPVQPGETILLCDVAINHKEGNANSVDLSVADFEWFDGADVDVDVPETPNMIKMVSTSASVWSLHNRGFSSYILFRMDDVTPEQFTTDYAYHYQYTFVWGDFVRVMEFDAWKVPNDKILDAVECSTPSDFEWKALDPSLDLSWTHSGDGDAARYGKSVKRKVAHTEDDGRKVLLDTNDSAFDFIATAEPSPGEIE
ncbi:DUF4876 domain-containing protein [Puteibacter caeruleilacunae]|nr:DUF4876 domain-containing protein [Puteibacter caeruleilacunae]